MTDVLKPSVRPARDFFVATGERRGELGGSKWDLLRGTTGGLSVPASVAPKTISADAWPLSRTILQKALAASNLDGLTPKDKLSLMLALSVLPLRWEPLNYVAEHRAVASAGGSFAVEAYLLCRSGTKLDVYRVDADAFALIHERSLDGDADPGDDVILVLVGRHAVCAAEYGAFSAPLLALEAGMIARQLTLLASLVGWRAVIEPLGRTCSRRVALGLDHWSDAPLVALSIDGIGIADVFGRGERQRIKTVRREPEYSAADAHAAMKPLLIGICGGAEAKPRPLATPFAIELRHPKRPPWTVLQAMAARSAGAATAALVAPHDWCAQRLEALLTDVAWLDSSGGFGALPLGVEVFASFGAEMKPVFRMSPEFGGVVGDQTPDAPVLFTLAIDDRAALERFEEAGFLAAHLRVGALAHSLCLAAGLQGLAARPLRSYADASLGAALPLDRRPLLQVRIGLSERANLAYRLG